MKVPAWQNPSLAPPRGPIGSTARHAVYLALAALVVACGENVTAPSTSRTPTLPAGANPDVVVMERTIDIAAHDGVAAVHKTFRQTLTGQVRVAKQGQLSAAATPAYVGSDISKLPRPSMSLPARFETAMCRVLPNWTKSMKAGATIAGEVQLTGVGDAPASTLNVVQDGKTVLTVERSWVRTAISWQLERQVTTSGDGRYRDVVTYKHLTANRLQPVANALPQAACATPSGATITSAGAASRSYYAPRVNPLLLSGTWLGTGTSAYYTGDCIDTSYGGDPCYDKQLAVYEAEAGAIATGAFAAWACTFAAIIVPEVCVAAQLAWGLANVRLLFAQASLNNCRAEQADKPKCGCGTMAYSLGGTTATNGSPLMPASPATPGTIHAPGTSLFFLSDDCTDGSGYGGGGGVGGGGGGGGWSCSYEVWEISYDGGSTWSYFGTFWTCVYQS